MRWVYASVFCWLLFLPSVVIASPHYTVLNQAQYRQEVAATRQQMQSLLSSLTAYRHQSSDQQIAFIVDQLSDIPYRYQHAMGEGDWQSNSRVYRPGAVHLNQHPVYTLAGLDCQTFVQVVMALLYSQNLNEFDQHYVDIAYGAANKSTNNAVHYYNRNHFVDGDFNPVNHYRGWLTDVTATLPVKAEAVTATLRRQHWFALQQAQLADHVQVLSPSDGEAMAARFQAMARQLPSPRFEKETISVSYLPKTALALSQQGRFVPNQALLDAIPTPAIAEIVVDPRRWSKGDQLMKDTLGTELTISHLGVLYRQTFQLGEVIYQHITCDDTSFWRAKHCKVTPVVCQQKTCRELMFAHATESHPRDFYWYQQTNGRFTCTATPPPHGVARAACNRVEQLPLFDYLTDYQFGSYWYMEWPAILGVHIEKLKVPAAV